MQKEELASPNSANTPSSSQWGNSAPEGITEWKSWHDEGANFEQMFKDTQSSFTKAQESKIEMAKIIADTDPSKLKDISDEKVVRKILQDKWSVDSLDELQMLYPDVLKTKQEIDESWDESKLEKMEREMKLWRYKETKTKTEEAIASALAANSLLKEGIPDVEDRIKEEMKYISQDLDANERVRRAVTIVAGSNGVEDNAFHLLRWVTTQKSSKQDSDKTDANLKRQQDLLREAVKNNNNI